MFCGHGRPDLVLLSYGAYPFEVVYFVLLFYGAYPFEVVHFLSTLRSTMAFPCLCVHVVALQWSHKAKGSNLKHDGNLEQGL